MVKKNRKRRRLIRALSASAGSIVRAVKVEQRERLYRVPKAQNVP